ncbi:MAG TPA: SLBB domain-containing protein, partial [Phnomibacter sp.]|nr:SLBB domain-containing protein [Phnomibacter sp.]
MKLKFFKQCLGLLLALFFLNIGTTAQVLNADNLRNVNVDALTDQEILNYYQQAKASGLDEKQLLMMATQRGMPAEQVQKLNDRLLILIGGSIRNGSNPVAQKPEESGKKSPDTDSIPEVKIARDSTIFGSELFYKASSVFQPPLHIAAPAGYVLGPSDELLLQVFGLSEQTYNLQVDKNGMVYIQNVGPILVAGLTIENATSLIRSRLASTIYRAINSGQTRISVTLGKIRSITVLVLGQASKPGTYTVNSLTSLFNLLFLCGGPSDMGSYRNLELRRGNEVYKKIDLYNFLLRGDRKDNVLLKDEDVLYIPYYTTRVAMEGQVKRPGKFELQPGESLDQLLTYCGGFTDSAYRSQIVVTRLGDAGRSLATLQASDYAGFRPQSADVFSVGKVNNRFLNRVSVQGA